MGITSKYIDHYPTASMTNNSPRDRYPACLPEVLSLKQQIIAICKVHNVINVITRGNKHRCFLPSGNSTFLALTVPATELRQREA